MKGNLAHWRNQPRISKVLKGLRAVIAVALCMTAWGFAQYDLDHARIKAVRIVWQDQHGLHMLNDQDVHAFLGPLRGKLRTETDQKERALRKLPYLSDAELCYDTDHALLVLLNHREPVLRVLPERTSGYYLAADGVGLPLRADFAAPVPVLLGKIPIRPPLQQEATNKGMILALKVKEWIHKDSLLEPMITQYVVGGVDSNALILKTISGQEIWVGTSMDLASKLRNLSSFYRYAPADSSPYSFRSINLVFKNQIVCR